MIEILTKNNIDEIFEEVKNYVDETHELPLLRIDDKVIFIGVNEDEAVYFSVKNEKKLITVLLNDPNTNYSSIKNAFDALVEYIATKK